MRCYNGCPDSKLQSRLDEDNRLRSLINAAGYTVTWFPNGEFYMAFKNYRPATGECGSLLACVRQLKLPLGE